MSTSPTATAPTAPPARRGAGRVTVLDVLRAELTRSRRSFTWGCVLVSVFMAAWAINLSRTLMSAGLLTDAGRWAGNILAWMSFYPAALALPVGTLVGAMYEWREQRVHGGGTLWRAVPPARVLACRCLVVSLSALACQLGWLAPVLVFAHASGSGWGPAGSYLLFATHMWVCTTGAGMVGLAAARVVGPVAVGLLPVAAFVWSTAGAVQAESSSWLILPWTWMLRPSLPLLGVHGNSTNLEPGAAAWSYPVLPGMVLCALSTLLLAAMTMTTAGLVRPGIAVGARRRTQAPEPLEQPSRSAPPAATEPARTTPTTASPAGSGTAPVELASTPALRSPVLALGRVLPWGLWTSLWLVLMAVLALTRTQYSSQTAVALLALAGLPVACTVVGITTWTSLRSAWRGVLMRVSPWRAVPAALLSAWLFLSAALTAAWAVAAAGSQLSINAPDRGALTGAVYTALVIPWVSAALVALSYLIAKASSVAVAVAASVCGLLVGLTVAGNEIIASAPVIWLTAPWGWAHIAGAAPQRWLDIVFLSTLVALAATAVAALLGRRAARPTDQ